MESQKQNMKKSKNSYPKKRAKSYKPKEPRLVYESVDLEEGDMNEGLIRAYTIVFREVMKSQDWSFKFGIYRPLQASCTYRV